MLSAFESRILELWNKNLSTSIIAAELGVTKNVICGRAFRMRERGVDIQPRAIGNQGPHKSRQIRGVNGAEIISIRPKKEAPLLDWINQTSEKKNKPLPEIKEAPTAKPLNIRFKDLTANSCRYVVNDGRPENFIFCGAPKERGPYCGAHAALCYIAPTYEQKRNIKRMSRFA